MEKYFLLITIKDNFYFTNNVVTNDENNKGALLSAFLNDGHIILNLIELSKEESDKVKKEKSSVPPKKN